MAPSARRLLSKRSRLYTILLILLSLFLLGTVAVLSTAKAYFSIDRSAYILPEELGTWAEIRWGSTDGLPPGWASRYPWLWKVMHRPKTSATIPGSSASFKHDDLVAAATEAQDIAQEVATFATLRDNSPRPPDPNSPPEKVPRIIHQTWKEDVLPPKWQTVRQGCAEMHPDYEYMLWTDASSRSFIAEHYPWFLAVFDSYPYAIQRADAIRYFVLHHYGGIYMDLDIGCNRRLDPLLRFEVILPVTRPVGVSNDLIFAAKGHAFMDQVIHNLVTFNHRYLTHYPTVMFSTGPMFVSASYGLYVDVHGPAKPSTALAPDAGFEGVRVLPKSLYGKNAQPVDVPDAFFRHFYGSSWHAGDAGFLIFLRDHGRLLMFFGACLVAYGAFKTIAPRLAFSMRRSSHRRSASSNRSSHRSAPQWVEVPFQTTSSSRTMRIQHRSISRHLAQTPETYLGITGDVSDAAEDSEWSMPSRPDLHARSSSSQLQTSCDPPATAARSTSNSLSVAAPKPQRVSMPLFELDDTDGEPSENSSESWTSADEPQGLLAWAGLGFMSSGTNSSSSSFVDTAPTAWRKASGVLLLPAYVMSRIGSPSLAFNAEQVATPDLSCHYSPADSWSSSSNPDARTPSANGRASLVDRAAQMLPKGWIGSSYGRGGADDVDLELSRTKGQEVSDRSDAGQRTPLAVPSLSGEVGLRRFPALFSMGSASAWLEDQGMATPTTHSNGFLAPSVSMDMTKGNESGSPTSYRTPPPPYDADDDSSASERRDAERSKRN